MATTPKTSKSQPLLRKMIAAIFKVAARLFTGKGVTKIGAIRVLRDKSLKYLSRTIPSSVRVGGHIMYLDPKDTLSLSVRAIYEPFETEICEQMIKPGDV